MLIFGLISLLTVAGGTAKVEYRPGGAAARAVWARFYAGDHEPELPTPLIAAGKKMTLSVCKAVAHKDMRLRRYAISALGYVGDRRALSTLQAILAATDEIYYFRGDALHAIYQIDRSMGKTLAAKYRKDHEYLEMLAKAIDQDAKWLTEPPGDNE